MNLDLFDRLEKGEQDNVNHIINILYKWANVEFAGLPSHEIKHAKEYLLQEVYYFALYGVGSAIANKPDPNDVDLLLVTNKFPNDEICKEQPMFMDLVRMLEEEYIISIDNNLERVYDRESDARLKFDVDRKGFKSVDIIYQWDILSPEHWERNDTYKLIPIFKVGAENPESYKKIMGGARRIPLEYLRISKLGSLKYG